MGFRETPIARQKRVDSIRPDIEALERKMDELGELNGEAGFVREAVRQACESALKGNYGIGAVAVHGADVVACGHDRLCEETNPCEYVLHAEMDVLRDYHKKVAHGHRYGDNFCMVTTIEPCLGCESDMLRFGVRRAIFGNACFLDARSTGHSGAADTSFREILKQENGVEYKIAEISPALQDACRRVFMVTKDSLKGIFLC